MSEDFKIESGDYGPRFALIGPWDEDFRHIMREQGVVGLYLNRQWGWKGMDLEFLRGLDFILWFEILDWMIEDVSPIHYLANLRHLGVLTDCKTKIDFTAFSELESCSLNWRARAKSVFECTHLKYLWFDEFKGKDSHAFSQLVNLRSLTILNGPLPDVQGFATLHALEGLVLGNLGKLTSLDGFEGLESLRRLRIAGCRSITKIDQIKFLSNLEWLNLTHDGEIESLKPITNLPNLNDVIIAESTNILDGDLSPLLTLPKLKRCGFRQRRHYSHSNAEIDSALRGGVTA